MITKYNKSLRIQSIHRTFNDNEYLYKITIEVMKMKILHLKLTVFRMKEMKKFYSETLEMEIIRENEHFFTIQAGKTQITFSQANEKPCYHFALRAGLAFYEYMYNKLSELDLLLPNEEGETSMYWEGKQLYFKDPDGNILEILERVNPYSENLSGWYDVCEMGLPTGDVQGLSEFLQVIPNENGSTSDTFRFYGDKKGNFILVKKGRNWYPTDQPAEIHPVTIEVEGDHYQLLQHRHLPYTIKVKNTWNAHFPAVQMRIARPTDQLEEIKRFYEEGLGLKRVGEFHGHQGYDGVMYGLPNLNYHLEFTSHVDGTPCPAPTKDNLLVFYMPDQQKINEIKNRLVGMGYKEVQAENPYWQNGGYTFEDPDGWRIVFFLWSGL
jgi:catechol 2,3-dioxygenase-like lactoylglutathione lyase family enzyme